MTADVPGEIPLGSPRERFAVGLLLPITIFSIAGNAIGGLLAPGWIGVGAEAQVHRWQKWATLTAYSAATLGMLGVMVFVLAVAGNPRTSISTRLVSTLGAGLVFFFASVAIGRALDPAPLIVLFAGAFAVLVAATVESVSPPQSRALGIQIGLLAATSVLRVAAWGIAWNAARAGTSSIASAQIAASAALLCELLAQAFLVVYLVHRPGARGAIASFAAIGVAVAVAMWALGANLSHAGTSRDAVQRALSLRVQGSGPLPSWIPLDAATSEIALLEHKVRVALLPSVFVELTSLTLPLAALATAGRATLPVLATMSLAIVSRGQVDAPLRALELTVAALAALALSRAAREAEAISTRSARARRAD